MLAAIPSADAYTFISKTIESSRVHLFDIITQYKAVFSHPVNVGTDGAGPTSEGDASGGLLSGWVLQRVTTFLASLDVHLPRLTDRIHSILGRCRVACTGARAVAPNTKIVIAPQHPAKLRACRGPRRAKHALCIVARASGDRFPAAPAAVVRADNRRPFSGTSPGTRPHFQISVLQLNPELEHLPLLGCRTRVYLGLYIVGLRLQD